MQTGTKKNLRAMFLLTVLTLSWIFGQTETSSAGTSVHPASAPEAGSGMSNAKLDALIRLIDKDAKGKSGLWEFTVENRVLLVVTDEKADRMRIMTRAAGTEGIDEKQLYRLMQANFDSALDARYAVAKQAIWGVFLHPLSTLSPGEFLSGVGQVVNLAETYGTDYSSGLLTFRGGDSERLKQRREVIDRLLRKQISL